MTGRSDTPAAPGQPVPTPRVAVQRWRLVVAQAASDRAAGEPSAPSGWDAVLRASHLPVAGLDVGAKPKLAIAAQLPPGMSGEAELVDVWLTERWPAWRVRAALEACTPPGVTLLDVYDVWLGEPSLPGQVVASVYRAELEPPSPDRAALRAAVDDILGAPTLPRIRRKGDRSVAYDLRPFVAAIEIIEAAPGAVPAVRMTLRHDPEKGIGRPEELISQLRDQLGAPVAPRTIVRERLLLASDESPGAQLAAGPSIASRSTPRRPGRAGDGSIR